MRFKRFFCLLLAVITMFSVCGTFASCTASELYSEGDGNLKILCTSFAPFDFSRVVGGERVTVTILQDSGADLHNYTPTAATLEAVRDADVFVYVGGTSDEEWVPDVIRSTAGGELITVCLMDCVEPIYAEPENDWNEHEHDEHEHEEDGHAEHSHNGHSHGADEHIWTSLRNAVACVKAITDVLCTADPKGTDIYTANAEDYITELTRLDKAYETVAQKMRESAAVFADRFPFVYLMHDYHIPYVAAFSGCSTEVNSSFEMQIELIETVRKHSLPFVITLEGNDKSLAEAIAAETGCGIISLDSLQSVKRAEIRAGVSYLDVMKSNLKILEEAYR